MKHFRSLLALSLFLSLGTLVGCDNNVSDNTSNPTTNNSIPSYATNIPDNVISVAQAVNIAKELASGQTTSSSYIVQGKVDDLYNTQYGNCHLIDDNGGDITVYGMYSHDGNNRFDSFKNPPRQDDTIIVEGKIMNFYNENKKKNIYEILNAKLLFVNGISQEYYETLNLDNSIGGDVITDSNIKYDEKGWTYSGSYYNNLNDSSTGGTLLSSLRNINSTKKKRTVGYGSMWDYYNQTDYDPNNKNKYIAFYKGTSHSKNEMNKEHVWPESRGGNLIEGDMHVIRPTLTKDNSSRGNSFYVEGKNSSSGGWDPKTAGMNENYRGQAARIVFYGVVANSSLKLVDTNDDGTDNNSMGKLSDLLKWNLQYPVQAEEVRRNEGIESIQGNRNPFIDNPSFACSIWGGINATTKQICSATSAISYKKEVVQRKNKNKHLQEGMLEYDFIKISITTKPKKEFE